MPNLIKGSISTYDELCGRRGTLITHTDADSACIKPSQGVKSASALGYWAAGVSLPVGIGRPYLDALTGVVVTETSRTAASTLDGSGRLPADAGMSREACSP